MTGFATKRLIWVLAFAVLATGAEASTTQHSFQLPQAPVKYSRLAVSDRCRQIYDTCMASGRYSEASCRKKMSDCTIGESQQ